MIFKGLSLGCLFINSRHCHTYYIYKQNLTNKITAMSSVCALYYLMPIKQIPVPGTTAVMRWFITSKAGAKCESSTVSIQNGKSSLNCMTRSMIKQMCHTNIILKIKANTLGKDVSFFALCIHILFDCHNISKTLEKSSGVFDLTNSQIHGIRRTASVK